MRKEVSNSVSKREEYRCNERNVHAVYDKVALFTLSIDQVSRRGEVDIFHSLVLVLGMFSFHSLNLQHRIHQGLIPPDPWMHSKTCPVQTLSHELLETIAGTVKKRQGHLQLSRDRVPFWNFVHAWRSLIGTPAHPASELIRTLSYPWSEPTGSLYPPLSKSRYEENGCPENPVFPLIEALREAAVNEVTEKARMVCAGRVPVELSDVVVEAALFAEELPLEPIV